MDGNFHAFVFITTIVVYIILRKSKMNDMTQKKSSNLIYVLSVPAILYGGYYFYNKQNKSQLESTSISDIINDVLSNEELLSTPFPITSESSF